MYIQTGKTYSLKFIDGFEALDGIYSVLGILSQAEMVLEDVSVEDTYTSLGKTPDEWVVDKPGYLPYQFIKIRSVLNEDVIHYISEKMLEFVPDLSIKKYLNLSLVTNLGTFLSEDDLAGIELKLKDILSKDHGIANEPVVVAYGESWLTDAEYLSIRNVRNSLKTTIVNPYGLQQKMAAENSTLRSRVADLENTLLPPSILSTHINPEGDILTVTTNKQCVVAGGTFVLHGSIHPNITATYTSGSNTTALIYKLSPRASNQEIITMNYTGPGITGPSPNVSLPNTLNLKVDNESTQL